MDSTEGQKTDIRKSFATRRRRQLMISIPILLLMFGVTFLGRKGQTLPFGFEPGTLVTLLFLVLAGAIAFSLWNWRCPACHGYLGKRISPKYYSRCGVELQ